MNNQKGIILKRQRVVLRPLVYKFESYMPFHNFNYIYIYIYFKVQCIYTDYINIV